MTRLQPFLRDSQSVFWSRVFKILHPGDLSWILNMGGFLKYIYNIYNIYLTPSKYMFTFGWSIPLNFNHVFIYPKNIQTNVEVRYLEPEKMSKTPFTSGGTVDG